MSDTDIPTPTEPPPAAEWSQDKIDRLAGRARDEGRKTAQQELLAELGADNLDTIKAQLAAAAEREQADKSEAERARDEATAAKAEADEMRARLARSEQDRTVTLALSKAKVEPTYVDDAMRLLDVEPGDPPEVITEAVESLKARIPYLFASSEGAPPAPSSVPAGGTGAKPPSGKTALEAGRDAFRARHSAARN